MSTIEERVAAGAAWLDEQRPGWWEDIDLGDLRMADACHCVLGQIFAEAADDAEYTDDLGEDLSGFDYAVHDLKAPDISGGFNISYYEDGKRRDAGELRAEWTALGTAWKQLIAARRAA